MARKLRDVESQVVNAAASFHGYLNRVLGPRASRLIDSLASRTDLLVFSGIIRNYFLGVDEARDVDLVLYDQVDISDLAPNATIRLNSFGGYKISYSGIQFDIWHVENTWAYQYQKVFNFYKTIGIPNTAFFNFSAIAYDYNTRTFLYTRKFLSFLTNRELDVVLWPNPNYDLCVVNTLYYKRKFNLRISERLSKFIIEFHRRNTHNYRRVQMKHFGETLFSDVDIEAFVNNLQHHDPSDSTSAKSHFPSSMLHNISVQQKLGLLEFS